MIDGVKINCIGTPPEKWLNNPVLNFCSKVNQQTGELLSNTQIAFYKGLQFTVTPSIIYENGFALSVRGSLATYYNNGKNNAFDFDIEMLKETIQELQTLFLINPVLARVTSFEFGANIEPHHNVKNVLEGLRAYQNSTFSGLKMDGVFNGLQLKRQNTTFKAYDKGQQTNAPESNLIRFEYCLKYSKTVNKFGFVVLNDLLDISKLDNVKPLLLDVWEQSIFFDNNYRRATLQRMNEKQKQKFLLYLDGTFWNDKQTKMQRKRAKDNFKALCTEFCTSSTQTEILDLLSAKLDKLTAEKCNQLQEFETAEMEAEKNTKMLPFTILDEVVNSNKNTPANQSKTTNKKKPKKAQFLPKKNCTVCGSDITEKKPHALYCSKRCNNSNQATKRKIERHKTKKAEKIQLVKILPKILKTEMLLSVEYVDNDNFLHSDSLYSSEISAPKEMIRKIKKVTVHAPKQAIFTGWNAKRLIKAISINAPP